MRLVIVTTHPIQYQAPLFRLLAGEVDLKVVFMMKQTPRGQAEGGFGTEFEWDVPLLEGYDYTFADNVSPSPSTNRRRGIVLRGHERLLASLRPDVLAVFGWFPHGYLQVVKWARSHTIPLVCRGESNLIASRSLMKKLVKSLAFRIYFRKFAAFAVIGKLNREFYLHYGVPKARLVDAPYSIDTAFFESEFQKHRPALRHSGPWRIGFSGKLIQKKRPLDLLAAIKKAELRKHVKLIIIGDGPLRRKMENRARELAIECEFRGFLNQSEIVRRGYADLDGLVLPSGEKETWGLVVNEAMTGGIPAVVSNTVGCAPDLIIEDVTGYVADARDVDNLAAQLTRLVGRLTQGRDYSTQVKAHVRNYSTEMTAAGLHEATEIAVG